MKTFSRYASDVQGSHLREISAAGWSPSKDIFVSSRDSTLIPEPPLGLRTLRMRSDFRYGTDDYMQWPQLFHPQHKYLSCIPLEPTNRECYYWRFRSVWLQLSHDVIVPAPVSGTNIELTFLNDEFYNQLCLHREYIEERVALASEFLTSGDGAKYLTDATIDRYRMLIKAQLELLHASIGHMRWCPSTLGRLSRDMQEFSRAWLTIEALYLWITTFEPRTCFRKNILGPPPTGYELMGAFVTNESDACELKRAHLTYCLIRPGASISSTVFPGDIGGFMTPDAAGVTMECASQITSAILWEGQEGDAAIILTIHSESCDLYRIHHPFGGYAFKKPDLDTSSPARYYPSASGAERTRQTRPSASGAPYSRKQEKAPIKKLEQTQAEFLRKLREPTPMNPNYVPTAIPAWANANLTLSNAPPPSPTVQLEDAFFHFPDPLMVLGGLPFRQSAYLRVYDWLKVAMLLRSFSPSSKPLSSRTWRNVLSFGVQTAQREDGEVHQSNQKASEKKDEVKELVKDWLRPCRDLDEDINIVPPVVGNKGDPKLLEEQDGQQLAWELFELNFRWELMALDHRLARPTESFARECNGLGLLKRNDHNVGPRGFGRSLDDLWAQDRQRTIASCFYDNLIAVHHFLAKKGLAAPTVEERLPYLNALWGVMNAWQTTKPPQWQAYEIHKKTANPVFYLASEWENCIAVHYCATFYHYFGRPACLPHTLR